MSGAPIYCDECGEPVRPDALWRVGDWRGCGSCAVGEMERQLMIVRLAATHHALRMAKERKEPTHD